MYKNRTNAESADKLSGLAFRNDAAGDEGVGVISYFGLSFASVHADDVKTGFLVLPAVMVQKMGCGFPDAELLLGSYPACRGSFVRRPNGFHFHKENGPLGIFGDNVQFAVDIAVILGQNGSSFTLEKSHRVEFGESSFFLVVVFGGKHYCASSPRMRISEIARSLEGSLMNASSKNI